MAHYSVTFFKDVENSNGRSFRAPQATIDVSCDDRDSAVDEAQRRFADMRSVSDWTMYADSFVVTECPAASDRRAR